MIAIEKISESNYKAYSTENFYIKKNDILYDVIFLPSENIEGIIETQIAIPAITADPIYISSKYFGRDKTILQEEIDISKEYILKALKFLPEENLYYVWFFYDEWAINQEYNAGDIVLYKNNLYKIKKPHISNETPDNNKVYQKINKSSDKIDEWNNEHGETYSKNELAKVGTHVYKSLIDNNTWSPNDFPAVWQLIS